MASVDPEIAKTQEDCKKVEEVETAPQKKRRNRCDQAQNDAKKDKRPKTTASNGDLLHVKPTLSSRRSKRLADSNATQAVSKRPRTKITVKSKDIDGGTTKESPSKLKPIMGSASPKIDVVKYGAGFELNKCCFEGKDFASIVRPKISRRSKIPSGRGETNNDWFKIKTFDLRGKGGGVVDSGSGGGGGGGAGGSGGNGGVTGG